MATNDPFSDNTGVLRKQMESEIHVIPLNHKS